MLRRYRGDAATIVRLRCNAANLCRFGFVALSGYVASGFDGLRRERILFPKRFARVPVVLALVSAQERY